uniref:Uncharacterized protein n=1 Tax=Caenorhabditis japonica TaxID=281687 RepID=A0A8R1I5H4_CAEJA
MCSRTRCANEASMFHSLSLRSRSEYCGTVEKLRNIGASFVHIVREHIIRIYYIMSEFIREISRNEKSDTHLGQCFYWFENG